MGRKKKRAAPNPRDRIFCYYCDRTFNTEQELLMHQREKHLRCPTCNKRMLSIPSLTIHSEQMHNTTVTSVPNAIPGRNSTHIDVLGMKGVPEEYYLALEGKSNKKTTYDNTDYQTYPPVQPYSQPQAYPTPGYPQQAYGGQPYTHGYQNQYPPQYPYRTQAYHAQNFSSQGYAYPPQQAYPTAPYPAHPTTYPQQTYGPQQPPVHSQPQPTPQNSSPYPAYAHPTSSARTQPQSNGPRPVPDEQPPSLPSAREETPTVRADDRAKPPATPVTSTGKPATQSEPGIIVVFDRTDVCMEELRAQLPQYRVYVPKP